MEERGKEGSVSALTCNAYASECDGHDDLTPVEASTVTLRHTIHIIPFVALSYNPRISSV